MGKTTTAVHLAAYLNAIAPTLLVDGDQNRSSLHWDERGNLPFKVCDEKEAVKLARSYEHIVIDTAAQPTKDELRKVRGVNSIYHNNGIQTWHVKPNGETENVEIL